jgi:hypothetical protein
MDQSMSWIRRSAAIAIIFAPSSDGVSQNAARLGVLETDLALMPDSLPSRTVSVRAVTVADPHTHVG